MIRIHTTLALASLGLVAPAAGQGTSVLLPLGPETAADVPMSLAFTPGGDELLIAHRDTDNLTFFDVAAGRAVATLDVGDGPTDVVVGPTGRFAAVVNGAGAELSLVHVGGRRLVGSVPLSIENPEQVELAPRSRLAVVGGAVPGGTWSFSVIDLHTRSERLTIDTPVRAYQAGLPLADGSTYVWSSLGFALSPRGTQLVVSDHWSSEVRVIDTRTGSQTVLGYGGGGKPANVVIDPEGRFAAFSHSFASNSIKAGTSLLDLATLQWIGPYELSSVHAGSSLAFLPDGATLAVGSGDQGVIFVDIATGATQSVGSGLRRFAATAGGAYLVTDGLSNTEVIDTASRTVSASLPDFQTLPEYFHFRAGCRGAATFAWLDSGSERVGFVDAAAGTLTPPAPTGEGVERDGPTELVVLPGGDRVLTLNKTSNNLSLVDLTTGGVLDDFDVGNDARYLTLAPGGNLAMVSNVRDRSVSIVDLTGAEPVTELVLPGIPHRIVFDSAAQRAYVGFSTKNTGMAVSIRLVGATGFVETVFAVANPGVSSTAGEVFLSADEQQLLVLGSAELLSFDAATGQLLGNYTGHGGNEGVQSAAGDRVIGRRGFGQLTTLDTAGPLAQQLATAASCGGFGLAFDATEQHVFETCSSTVNLRRASDLSTVSSRKIKNSMRSGVSLVANQEYHVAAYSLGTPQDFELQTFSQQGTTLSFAGAQPLVGLPTDAEYSAALDTVVLTQPGEVDALELVP